MEVLLSVCLKRAAVVLPKTVMVTVRAATVAGELAGFS
jgi:hypothetical protein